MYLLIIIIINCTTKYNCNDLYVNMIHEIKKIILYYIIYIDSSLGALLSIVVGNCGVIVYIINITFYRWD